MQTHAYTHIYIHNIYIYIYMYICLCVYICDNMYVCIYIVYIYTYMCVCAYRDVCAIYINILCVYRYTCGCTCTYIHKIVLIRGVTLATWLFQGLKMDLCHFMQVPELLRRWVACSPTTTEGHWQTNFAAGAAAAGGQMLTDAHRR